MVVVMLVSGGCSAASYTNCNSVLMQHNCGSPDSLSGSVDCNGAEKALGDATGMLRASGFLAQIRIDGVPAAWQTALHVDPCHRTSPRVF